MLFITLMIKMSDTAEAKYKYDKNSPKLSRAPQGRRRCSGTAAEQIKNCAQVLEEGRGRRDIYRGPPFCPG